MLVSMRYPLFGLMLIIFLVFNVFPERFFPEFPFFGGKLKIYDLLLLYMTTIVTAAAVIKNQSIRGSLGPAFWPLLYVISFVAVSAVYGRMFLHNVDAISEARNHIGWLIIPLAVLCVDTPQKLKIFIRVILSSGLIIAVYVVIQSLFQIQIMGGRVEALDLRGNQDVTRSTAGGGVYLIVFSLFYFFTMAQARRVSLWVALIVSIILVAGLAVTFGRGVWVATALGLMVASILYQGVKGGAVTAMLGALLLAVVLFGMTLVSPRTAEALVDRVMGIGTEISTGGSFHHRTIENSEAIKSITRKPILGVGIGGEYKQVVSSVGAFDIETRYIHNAYLYFPLKMGILAFGIPFAFMTAFVSVFRTGKWFSSLSLRDRALPAATAGAFLVPMVTSFTQPEWTSMQGIVVISLLFITAWLTKRLGQES
jgi:hypothetical protein